MKELWFHYKPTTYLPNYKQWEHTLRSCQKKEQVSKLSEDRHVRLEELPPSVASWIERAKNGEEMDTALVMKGPPDSFKSGFIAAHFPNKLKATDIGNWDKYVRGEHELWYFSERSYFHWEPDIVVPLADRDSVSSSA